MLFLKIAKNAANHQNTRSYFSPTKPIEDENLEF